ncbi:MAG: ArnT family glycosyltransferase [Gemmatimonadaceae bacterium]
MRFFVVVLLAALVARFERGRISSRLGGVQRALESRSAPLVFGLVFGAIVWWTWGQVHPYGLLHDELAYVLQAKLFASGRWTAPAPPMPEFFAQPHVLNDPLVASKYPPGHSLLLAIGELLFGMPAVVVAALSALRGALAFAIARRLTNGAIALGTGMLLLHGQSLYFGASFFSETTTGAMLLVAWYALLRWRAEGGRGWMALVALAVGWCAITRPFSAVLFALPIAFVVLRGMLRTRRWRELAVGLAVGTAVLAILPLWSARTTGDWRVSPVAVYMRDYMPFDRPHFGYDSTPPRRTPPADLAFVNASLDSVQRTHTLAAVPQIARERWTFLAMQSWWEPIPELGFAVLGLILAPPAALVGVVTALIVFVGYLAHPTWPSWTIYYMETAPVFAFYAVCGFTVMLRALAREPEREWSWVRGPRAAFALLVTLLLTLPMIRIEMRFNRNQHLGNANFPSRFAQAVAHMPPRSILFVRHAKWHEGHWSLVTNEPDFAAARTWIAYDRGDSLNQELLRRAGGRTAFLFDEARHSIDPYAPVVTASTER